MPCIANYRQIFKRSCGASAFRFSSLHRQLHLTLREAVNVYTSISFNDTDTTKYLEGLGRIKRPLKRVMEPKEFWVEAA